MRKIPSLGILFLMTSLQVFSQKTLQLGKQTFELHNVTGSIIKFEGKQVLKIERDLKAIPFDASRLEATVDEPLQYFFIQDSHPHIQYR